MDTSLFHKSDLLQCLINHYDTLLHTFDNHYAVFQKSFFQSLVSVTDKIVSFNGHSNLFTEHNLPIIERIQMFLVQKNYASIQCRGFD